MNERIKELAYQAEEYADSVVDQGGEFHPAYTQKFAELIVKECAEFIDSKLERGDEIYSCADGGDLKQHFGVEE